MTISPPPLRPAGLVSGCSLIRFIGTGRMVGTEGSYDGPWIMRGTIAPLRRGYDFIPFDGRRLFLTVAYGPL